KHKNEKSTPHACLPCTPNLEATVSRPEHPKPSKDKDRFPARKQRYALRPAAATRCRRLPTCCHVGRCAGGAEQLAEGVAAKKNVLNRTYLFAIVRARGADLLSVP